MSRFRIDYRTLVAVIGVIVSTAVLLAVLNAIDMQDQAADALAAKDKQIAKRDTALALSQVAAADALAAAKENGAQIDLLIVQIEQQNTLLTDQAKVVTALRNELAKRGFSTVVDGDDVKVVRGPVAVPSAQPTPQPTKKPQAQPEPESPRGPGGRDDQVNPPQDNSGHGNADDPEEPKDDDDHHGSGALQLMLGLDVTCNRLVCTR